MTAAVGDKTDVMYEILYNPKKFTPVPSPQVNVKTTIAEGKTSYLMKNHATGTYYDLDELTNLIWDLTDGKRTVSQIVKEVQRQKPKVRGKTVLENLLFFADSNLLKVRFEEKQKKRFKVVSPFEIDFTLIRNSHNFIHSLHSRIHPIFKRWLLWATIVFIIAGAVLFAREFVSVYGQKANFEILGSSVVGFFFYYFVPLAPVIAIHEIAHTITLVHYGGQAGEMGTGLFYFSPMFYTDTTDAWGLRRGERMMVYLAGNISTLLIGTALVLVHLFVQIPGFASHIVLMVAFYCFSMSLMNFAPPFETDGYYILSDAVSMPNLRHDSYGYLGSVIRRVFRRPVKIEASGLNNRRKRVFLLYGLVSVAWIAYIIFQTSLFLAYMGQDVTAALANIGGAILSSQAIPVAAVAIAAASTLYFGMQLTGYSFAFSAAVKKAMAKPLTLEAIHDRDLAVFAYLPPEVPESLSNHLRSRMEKIAKKFTPKFEIKQVGRSCLAILRMGGTNLALVQIKGHLKRIENEFNSAYEKFVLGHKDTIQSSVGIYAPHKIGLTNTFRQFAAESVDAGNSTAVNIAKACENTQKETLLYLLQSASSTVWTIEVQPAQEYEFVREMVPSLLLEDMTLTDLYHDTENFKKRIVYGYDSLMVLATETEISVKEGLARPDECQCLSVLEPIKSRIVLVGRTEQIENKIDAFASVFIVYTWSGYVDNILCETCLKLSTINRVRLPSAEEIDKMSIGELAVLSKDLSMFDETQELLNTRMQKTEEQLAKMNGSLAHLKDTAKALESFKIGNLDAALRVNTENLAAIPSRIKGVQKDWKTLCKRIERVRMHVEKAYSERKPVIAKKKRHMLLVSPFMIILSVLLFVLGFHPMLAPWSVALFSVAAVLQVVFWTFFYQAWGSLHKVTKYSSQPFNAVHIVLLALTEAIFGYIATEDVLTPVETAV
jgi:putative peptide zinc metalloprotease protein